MIYTKTSHILELNNLGSLHPFYRQRFFASFRTEMFQPIINKALNEEPMTFSRTVKRVLDEIDKATIKYLHELKTVN